MLQENVDVDHELELALPKETAQGFPQKLWDLMKFAAFATSISPSCHQGVNASTGKESSLI